MTVSKTPQFKHIVYDLEADNLYRNVTKLWCGVTVDIPTGVVKGYRPEELSDLIDVVTNAELIVGHNILDYDNPALTKLYGVVIEDWRCIDTMVWSRLFYPDRPGGHSLRSWGIRLGEHKGDFDDFSCFSEEMFAYCLQDGVVNYKLLQYFQKSLGWDLDKLVEWTHEQSSEL